MQIAVIGGGAAGLFSSITAKENFPQGKLLILEKSKNLYFAGEVMDIDAIHRRN